jgi:hypothetical protein
MVRDWGAEKTTLDTNTRHAVEADSVLPADPGAPSTRTVIITPGQELRPVEPDQITGAYRLFQPVNRDLLAVCTAWQLRTIAGQRTG